jgi:hypothetical protein
MGREERDRVNIGSRAKSARTNDSRRKRVGRKIMYTIGLTREVG